MQRLEYHTIDKSGWGDGPWQSEPDKIQWQDKATGYPCLIVRNGASLGFLCGYVGVPATHPAHGLSYDGNTKENAKARTDAFRKTLRKKYRSPGPTGPRTVGLPDFSGVPDEIVVPGIGEAIREISVHGGLTFAGGCQPHANEAEHICHKPDPGEPDDIHWFGFDCGHAFDMSPGMRPYKEKWASEDPEYAKLLKKIESQDFRMKDVYRDIAYVTAEVESLAKQLKAMEKVDGQEDHRAD